MDSPSYKVITPPDPTKPVVSLADARAAVRADNTAEDAYIQGILIPAAVGYCERAAGRAFITQTVLWKPRRWPMRPDRPMVAAPYAMAVTSQPRTSRPEELQFPFGPVQSITSIQYRPSAGGALVTIDSAKYRFDDATDPGTIAPAPGETWPDLDTRELAPIEITYKAGYADDSAGLDPCVKQAVLLLASHWFANREPVVTGTIAIAIQLSLAELLSQLRDGRLR